MKQIIQDLRNGATILTEAPAPRVRPGHALIRTHRSLVSLGTERMLVEFGKANLLQKVRQQPDKVKQVLEKAKTDGWRPTLQAVRRKLSEPLPLGYCNAGEVIALGEGVEGLRVGDRVVSNGRHAEVVCVPKNLIAKIPDAVSYEQASFTVIGAIALQGIRLLRPTFGETVVVPGLGLIGLLAVQLLRAHGCRVIGLDLDPRKVALARSFDVEAFVAEDPVELVLSRTAGVGADAVLIAASTKGDSLISQCARMSRKRGRIVLVGVVGLDLQRADFYEKELSFQVSCSYGPGRYDDNYEVKGLDYPLPYVRWTEQRNFVAVLDALADARLRVDPLITEMVDLEDYQRIYGDMRRADAIASILRYPARADAAATQVSVAAAPRRATAPAPGALAIIGAGGFTMSTVLPALKKLGADMRYIVSAGGLSAATAARKFGIPRAATDYRDALADPAVDAVLIATRHDMHAAQVVEALRAGKHVFVEKPLALSFEELEAIEAAYHEVGDRLLAVGFNRRFSPFSQEAEALLSEGGALINVVATMNAGFLPKGHWAHDPRVGGGRIVGEACHLVDLISFFVGGRVERVAMNVLGADPDAYADNAVLLLRYDNGAQGVVNYFANGSKAYPKERVEIHAQQRSIVIDNFRRAYYYGFKKRGARGRQDKGHLEQFRRFLDSVRQGGPAIIPFDSLLNTSRATLAALQASRRGEWVEV
jgi:predicted dehydrogenase/threonine dehydrogenase-like Zn-dependent dehydrogenase